jgi:hypothetical protein
MMTALIAAASAVASSDKLYPVVTRPAEPSPRRADPSPFLNGSKLYRPNGEREQARRHRQRETNHCCQERGYRA